MLPALRVLAVLVLCATALVPVSVAVGQDGSCVLPNSDTTPPFMDRCYHQGVWFIPDTTEYDIVILPPTTPYALREWQLIEQSVTNWEVGIHTLGAPSMSGLHINDYSVGRERVPAAALLDPEVIIAIHTNAGPLGSFLGLATTSSSPCLNVPLPVDPDAIPDWHSHDGVIGSFSLACGTAGGRICVVTNAATLTTPSNEDRRMDFDLVSHEVGHCLSLGHVGDADDAGDTTDNSIAYPEHDIMSYENDGLHASTMHCPSNLNIRVIEKAFGIVLGRPGASNAVAPAAAGYVHMQPGDWQAPACFQSGALVTDTGHLLASDPLAEEGPDADGDDVPDGQDACAGGDDRFDIDADGSPDACDADDNDGPAGDLDGDGVRNADDQCPGIDDFSPACLGNASLTWYLGAGTLGTPSGNAEVLWGETEPLQLSLRLKEDAPTAAVPSVLAIPVRDVNNAAHNPVYDPGEWRADGLIALQGQDVDVVWWGISPVTGAAVAESWDVSLFFNGAVAPTATARVTASAQLQGQAPTEYRATFPDVTGNGRLSVLIDATPSNTQADLLVLYDAVAFPSRVVVGPVPDSDGDGVVDPDDVCPGFDDLADADADGLPDGCDPDDNDGPAGDLDGDGITNALDICAGFDDAQDLDGDGTPDGCDDDRDGDGVDNAVDNCRVPNPDQADLDSDGLGDACDPDADGDSIDDLVDNCPSANSDQADLDGDGAGDACDDDIDGDGVANDSDAFPWNATESADSDADGVGDNADLCPGSPDGLDLDADGVPDGCDEDRDGDGFSNDEELAAGSDPDDAASVPVTTPECPDKPNGKPGKCKEPVQGANGKPSFSRPSPPSLWRYLAGLL